ncbi:hypothetical protein ACM01_27450 [Streptomyces viridochromogenes]|uniref:DUF1330 domain-containing protein n=1 Tax=Streptomyces viridochromogenes TaxID=1938 RepID=A0A0J7Z744_STRVR|nr:DUF1330 domain-containing protein [Streptomyces viridochromogenes]KMS71327.1 hypothetical protein ACM01_27450 [Streptomyces viridochromogenes]KOG16609.1 hypothetical protein ADK36_26705 [Streptomyces viridochromogenes]KOG17315.1 hypothetical protein ADK35_24185 [Streptomyces viridochromogenes]
MSAFVLFEGTKIIDDEKLEKYKDLVPATIAKFGGRYRVLGGNPSVVEGDWSPSHLVMIEFPSFEQAKAWYESSDYEPLKQMRFASAEGTGIIMEGLRDAYR